MQNKPEVLNVSVGLYTKGNKPLSEKDMESLGIYLANLTGRTICIGDYEQITDMTWQWTNDEEADFLANAKRFIDIAQDYWVIVTDCFTAPMAATVNQMAPMLAEGKCEGFAGVISKITNEKGKFIRWGHLL